jgi:hypothetical protein
METITNIQILNEPSIITSINYPQQYAGGETYTWKIVFESGKYIQLLFTNILLNIHTVSLGLLTVQLYNFNLFLYYLSMSLYVKLKPGTTSKFELKSVKSDGTLSLAR